MKVLVTGGAGYIGSHTTLCLLESGHEVTLIDDLSTGNENLIPNGVEFINCNINELERIDSIIKKNKFNAIMHFAGFVRVEESVNFPEKYFINNTKNSIQLFDICIKNNRIRSFVFT